MDGDGARLYGGRWNPKGHAVVYTSECLPLATLEAFVHFVRRPDDQVRRQIVFDEKIVKEVEILYGLPPDWKEQRLTTQNIGARWITDASSAVLSVPSAVVAISRNYLINPNHPEFSLVECSDPTTYDFDDRLLDRLLRPRQSPKRSPTAQPLPPAHV